MKGRQWRASYLSASLELRILKPFAFSTVIWATELSAHRGYLKPRTLFCSSPNDGATMESTVEKPVDSSLISSYFHSDKFQVSRTPLLVVRLISFILRHIWASCTEISGSSSAHFLLNILFLDTTAWDDSSAAPWKTSRRPTRRLLLPAASAAP